MTKGCGKLLIGGEVVPLDEGKEVGDQSWEVIRRTIRIGLSPGSTVFERYDL